MSNFPYLVGLALIEQCGNRIMPIGGKSLKEPLIENDFPNSIFEDITLEILLRLIERSEESAIHRLNGENSILIAEIPLDALQKDLPSIKQVWIKSGDSDIFMNNLKKISSRLWSSNFVRYEGIKYKKI